MKQDVEVSRSAIDLPFTTISKFPGGEWNMASGMVDLRVLSLKRKPALREHIHHKITEPGEAYFQG